MVMLEMGLAAEGWTGSRHSHGLQSLHNHSCSCRFHLHALGTREHAVLTVGLLQLLLKFSSDASGMPQGGRSGKRESNGC